MRWELADEELERVVALDVDARYAYAINTIAQHGELWTLGDEGEWVTSTDDRGRSIPIWPHERFAQREATAAWAKAVPIRIVLEQWLTAERAAWFDEHDLGVMVFLVGESSMAASHAILSELIRGERRESYLRGRRASGVARDRKRATRVTEDLVSYVSHGEIALVLERVPRELRARVRDVFAHRSSGATLLGNRPARGRRDIELNARLPIRVSLGRYLHGGQSPDEFGAPKLGQWPPWSVRRFLLYGALFHEVGHLQVVDPTASREDRKFASETKAQEFADELRRTLYSEAFEHPDPIHNVPTAAELATLEVWNRLDKAQRGQLVRDVLSPSGRDSAAVARLEPLTAEQRGFLSRVLASRA